MTQHDWQVRVQHMLDYSLEAVEMLGDNSLDDLQANRVLQLALTQLIQIVGEAATRVPEQVRTTMPQIPWSQAVGMRHRLVHGYDLIDFEVLFDTIRDSLPPLIQQLKQVLSE
jgi:uncharacterized protein with HEPN domain